MNRRAPKSHKHCTDVGSASGSVRLSPGTRRLLQQALLDRFGLSPKARRFVQAALDKYPRVRVNGASILRAIDAYQIEIAERLSDQSIPDEEAADLENDLLYFSTIKSDIRHALLTIGNHQGILLGRYDVAVVKAMLHCGYCQHQIAALFDVNPARIAEIKAGKIFPTIAPEFENRLPLSGPFGAQSRKLKVESSEG